MGKWAIGNRFRGVMVVEILVVQATSRVHYDGVQVINVKTEIYSRLSKLQLLRVLDDTILGSN
jgi:hypothetical protein